jgi:hypothetical protein
MPDVTDITEVLPEDDARFLKEKYPDTYIVRRVGAEFHIVLRGFSSFPAQYSPRVSDLLLKLPAGYPNAAPDMFWTRPDVKLTSGAWPKASEHHEVPGSGNGSEVYENVPWQRWSRHPPGPWNVGVHGLRSFVQTIIQELKKGI